MFSNFYARNRWRQFHDRTPLIIEREPNMERQEGGNYLQDGVNELFEVRMVNAVQKGASRMKESPSGLQYVGTEEFYIPYDEIERIGLPGVLQKGTKVYLNPWVLRVTNVNPINYQRIYRVQTERTRDGFPNFVAAWDFENDTLGETPSGWDINDPSVSGDKVVIATEPTLSTKVISIENVPVVNEHSQACLQITKYLPGAAVKFKFDFMLDWYDTGSAGGLLAFFHASPEITDPDLADTDNIVYIVGLLLSGGKVYLRTLDTPPYIIDKEITTKQWYHVEITIDLINALIYGTIDSEEFSADATESGVDEFLSAIYMCFSAYKLPGGVVPGVGARMFIDNVEVDCLNAL